MECIEIAIEFYRWMKENDTAANAERFFHYTDQDMFMEFLIEKGYASN